MLEHIAGLPGKEVPEAEGEGKKGEGLSGETTLVHSPAKTADGGFVLPDVGDLQDVLDFVLDCIQAVGVSDKAKIGIVVRVNRERATRSLRMRTSVGKLSMEAVDTN